MNSVAIRVPIAWTQTGITNVVVNYNVSRRALLWRHLADQCTSSNYSNVTSVTFGIKGGPESVKVEFDRHGRFQRGNRVFTLDFTNPVKYYTVSMDDLTAAGLDSARIKNINFVVDQGLAGAAKNTAVISQW